MRNPLLIGVGIFRGRPKPNIAVSGVPITRQHFSDILRPLRQELPIQSIASADEIEQVGAPRRFNLVIERIGEGSAKYSLSPPVLCLKSFGLLIPRDWIPPISVRRTATRMIPPLYLTTSLCPFFRVTKIAG